MLIRYSSFSEQKIDGIAKGIDSIRLLLKEAHEPPDARPSAGSTVDLKQASQVKVPIEHPACILGDDSPPWDKSTNFIDFVKAVVQDRGSQDIGEIGSEENKVLLSLRNLLQSLQSPIAVTNVRDSSFAETQAAKYQSGPLMPPLDATVKVLRWAKGSLLTLGKSKVLRTR